jgi:hypothetical protein
MAAKFALQGKIALIVMHGKSTAHLWQINCIILKIQNKINSYTPS